MQPAHLPVLSPTLPSKQTFIPLTPSRKMKNCPGESARAGFNLCTSTITSMIPATLTPTILHLCAASAGVHSVQPAHLPVLSSTTPTKQTFVPPYAVSKDEKIVLVSPTAGGALGLCDSTITFMIPATLTPTIFHLRAAERSISEPGTRNCRTLFHLLMSLIRSSVRGWNFPEGRKQKGKGGNNSRPHTLQLGTCWVRIPTVLPPPRPTWQPPASFPRSSCSRCGSEYFPCSLRCRRTRRHTGAAFRPHAAPAR